MYFHNTEMPKQITDRQLKSLIQTVSKNTKLIDVNTDHNQVLDVIQYAKKNNIEIPKIIVNFDTHSDIYLNDPGLFPDSGVEDWLNEYIAYNQKVDTLYWVLPDEEAQNSILKIIFAIKDYNIPKDNTPLFGNSLDNINWLYFIHKPLYKESFTQEFLLDTKTKKTNEYIEKNKLNEKLFRGKRNYKKIKIVTCTKDSLPNLKGEKVFLSIDADYMSNSGFDTVLNFKFIKSEDDIQNTFYSIFETVKNRNIEPVIISMSLSPQYLPKLRHKFVEKMLNQTIQYSQMKDLISSYKHHYNPKRYE